MITLDLYRTYAVAQRRAHTKNYDNQLNVSHHHTYTYSQSRQESTRQSWCPKTDFTRSSAVAVVADRTACRAYGAPYE